MNKEIFNSTLNITESDVNEQTSIDVLINWGFIVKKDIININEKYDQNSNPLLVREGQSEEDTALAAHRALYALKRQQLFLELIDIRINHLIYKAESIINETEVTAEDV